jgi:hypothetical protein
VHYRKLGTEDLQPVIDEVARKLVVGGGDYCLIKLKSFSLSPV